MNSGIFLSLVLAHVIGDFYLQTDKYCKEKEERKLSSKFLYAHIVTMGLLSWATVPAADFAIYALIIMASHFVIDVCKIYARKGMWSFLLDQSAHIVVLATIACLFQIPQEWSFLSLFNFQTSAVPLFVLAILLCMKPANILIKQVLAQYQVGASETCTDMKNAGALIGNLERILTIIFVMIGQYEAIGFIVAAKSLLRFKDTDTAKTEYVLAGTFLSFGIAIICGLIAKL